MLFNSIEFLIFFPVVVLLFGIIPQRFRNWALLAASYYFYMCWKPEYIVLIIVSTAIDYYASGRMDGIENLKEKRKWLILSLFSNLGLLFSFKYFNFFSSSLGDVLNFLAIPFDAPELRVLLPVGISFYTFQTMSYSIDVYRGVQKSDRNFGNFALYVSFFPQLVAGPIERSRNMLAQIKADKHLDYSRIRSGLQLMAWGFFKKIVLANRLAVYVDGVYNNVDKFTGVPLIFATYCFAFQIYCDFSGYSDIAIGAARIFGIDLMKNFDRPYSATSFPEFWNRWHISLSTWLRDYLFLPVSYLVLGKVKGDRFMKLRVDNAAYVIGMTVTMFLGGLWHGAKWTFVLWGVIHGLYLALSHLTKKFRKRVVKRTFLKKVPVLRKFINTIFIFNAVCLTWIFFRANSIQDAIYIVRNIFRFDGYNFYFDMLSVGKFGALVIVLAIAAMELIQYINSRVKISDYIEQKRLLRWGAYYLIVFVLIVFGEFRGGEFIYFQF